MFNFLNPEAPSPTPRQIAYAFRWLGWVGFALQSFLGLIPILVVVMVVLFDPKQQQQIGLSLGLWLAIACLGMLIFSIYWCFRYTRLADLLEVADLRPGKVKVYRELKLGLVVNIGIMVIGVVIALLRVSALTFKMLTLPPGSTVISPNQAVTTVAQGTVIAPSNMIAIQAMVHAIAAGLVGIIVSLLLIAQVGKHRNPKESFD